MKFTKYLIFAVAGALYYNSQPSSPEGLPIHLIRSGALTKPNRLGDDVLQTQALWLQKNQDKKLSDFLRNFYPEKEPTIQFYPEKEPTIQFLSPLSLSYITPEQTVEQTVEQILGDPETQRRLETLCTDYLITQVLAGNNATAQDTRDCLNSFGDIDNVILDFQYLLGQYPDDTKIKEYCKILSDDIKNNQTTWKKLGASEVVLNDFANILNNITTPGASQTTSAEPVEPTSTSNTPLFTPVNTTSTTSYFLPTNDTSQSTARTTTFTPPADSTTVTSTTSDGSTTYTTKTPSGTTTVSVDHNTQTTTITLSDGTTTIVPTASTSIRYSDNGTITTTHADGSTTSINPTTKEITTTSVAPTTPAPTTYAYTPGQTVFVSTTGVPHNASTSEAQSATGTSTTSTVTFLPLPTTSSGQSQQTTAQAQKFNVTQTTTNNNKTTTYLVENATTGEKAVFISGNGADPQPSPNNNENGRLALGLGLGLGIPATLTLAVAAAIAVYRRKQRQGRDGGVPSGSEVNPTGAQVIGNSSFISV